MRSDSSVHRAWPVLQHAIEATPVNSSPAYWWQQWAQRVGFKSRSRSRLPPGIYILAYHGVVDPQAMRPWELHYRKGQLTVEPFATQLDILSDLMTPIALSEIPALWERHGVDRPYFAVTFDDGWQNNLDVAHPEVCKRGLVPTVFVNGRFAQGGVVYRVLVAILVNTGHALKLAAALRDALPAFTWSDDPKILFDQTKTQYQAGVMEETVEQVYRHWCGDPAVLGVHLDVAGVKRLHQEGWEIGNHTFAHRILTTSTLPEVAKAVEDNERFWHQAGIPLIPFLSFPFGRAVDVNVAVYEYLREHSALHGMFAAGGINFSCNRTEWLRFSLGAAKTKEAVLQLLHGEIARSRKALDRCWQISLGDNVRYI